MSLKTREIIAWIIMLFSALFWIFGTALANDPSIYDVLTGVGENGMVATTACGTFLSLELTSVTEHSQETTTVLETDEYGEAAEPPELSDDEVNSTVEDEYDVNDEYFVDSSRILNLAALERICRLAGVLMCFAAICMTAVYVFVLRQSKSLFGPDGICLTVGVLWLLFGSRVDNNVFLWTYGTRAVFVFFKLLMYVSVGIALREIFCWAMFRFSCRCCLVHRFAVKFAKPQFSLFCYWVWMVGAVCGGFFAVVRQVIFGRHCILPISVFVLMLVLGFLCFWKYGKDVGHLKKQLENYKSGLPIEVGTGSFSDTEALLLEAQARQEEAVRTAVVSERFKVELISNVSHDLRTPLTSIIGYSELLQKEDLSPKGIEQLRLLHMKAGYMNDLVESLFELTKVSSGDLPAKMENIDLIRLLEQTVGLFEDQVTDAGLVVRRNYNPGTLFVYTDGTRIHQVFANLLSNAIKYAMPGTRIYLDAGEAEECCRVRIMNTASYEMDFESDEIVKRFARGDKARTTKGSGLGLAIAKTYTESLDGKFYVTVDGDQFSAFVELPKTVRDL